VCPEGELFSNSTVEHALDSPWQQQIPEILIRADDTGLETGQGDGMRLFIACISSWVFSVGPSGFLEGAHLALLKTGLAVREVKGLSGGTELVTVRKQTSPDPGMYEFPRG